MPSLGDLYVSLEADTRDFNRDMNSAFKGVQKFAKLAIGLFAGGVIVNGFKNMAKATAEFTDRIDKMSQKLGISRKAFQEFDFILSQSGVSIDRAGVGLRTLASQAVASERGAGRAFEAFRMLGVEVRQSNGLFKEREQLFEDVVIGLQNMEDQTLRTAVSADLFGMFGRELTPILNQNASSIEELRQQAYELGLILDDQTIDAGVEMTDTMDRLNRTFKSAKVALGSVFLPLLKSMIPVAQNVSRVLFSLSSQVNAFFATLFGKEAQDQQQNLTDSTQEASSSQLEFGEAVAEAGKEAKGALAGFDELNVLQQDMAEGLSGAIPTVTDIEAPQITGTTETDLDTTQFSVLASKLRELEPIFTSLKSTIIDFWNTLKQLGKTFTDFIVDITRQDIESNLTTAFRLIAQAFEGAIQSAKGVLQVTDAILAQDTQKAKDGWTEFLTGLDKMFLIVGEVGGRAIISTFEAIGRIGAWAISNLINVTVDFFMWWGKLSSRIATGADEGIKALNKMLTDMWNSVKIWWTNFSLSEEIFNFGAWLASKWQESAINTWIQEKLNAFYETLKGIWQNFVTTSPYSLLNIMDWIQLKWKESFLGKWISQKWTAFVGVLQSLWDTFKSKFSASSGNSIFNISNWIKYLWETGNPIQYIQRGWEALVAKLKSLWEAFKQTSIFDFASWIAQKVASIPNAIKGAFNSIFGTGGTQNQYWGLSPSTMGAPRQMAKGGLTTRPTFAMVGDNPSGQEAVLPLDNMGVMDKIGGVIAEAVTGIMQSNNNTRTGQEVAVNIDGRQLARAIIPAMNAEETRRGTARIITD